MALASDWKDLGWKIIWIIETIAHIFMQQPNGWHRCIRTGIFILSPGVFANSKLMSDFWVVLELFCLKHYTCRLCIYYSEEASCSPARETAALLQVCLTSAWNPKLILYSFLDIVHRIGEYLKRDWMNCDQIIQETVI